jgi:hypothetical protein
MRLKTLESGHRLREKLKLALIRVLAGYSAPDVVRMLFYRPEFLGRPLTELTQQVMRGPSPWRVGERELFAAFVSRLNQCPF